MRPPPQRSVRRRVFGALVGLALAVLLAAPGGVWMRLALEVEAARPGTSWLETLNLDTSAATEPVLVGRTHLGQRPGPDSAAEPHMTLRSDGKTWWLRNLALTRRALLIYDNGEEHLMRRWRLMPGDKFVLGDGSKIDVTDISKPTTEFSLAIENLAGVTTRYQVRHRAGYLAKVRIQGDESEAHRTAGWLGGDACADAAWNLRRFKEPVQAAVAPLLLDYLVTSARRTIVKLGGMYGCEKRIPAVDTPPGALRLEFEAGKIYLTGDPVFFDAVTAARAGGARVDFSDLEWPVQGVAPALAEDIGPPKFVVLGRTRYAIDAQDSRLALTAIQNRHVYLDLSPDQIDPTLTVAHLTCVIGAAGAVCPEGRQPADMGPLRVAISSESPGGGAATPAAIASALWLAGPFWLCLALLPLLAARLRKGHGATARFGDDLLGRLNRLFGPRSSKFVRMLSLSAGAALLIHVFTGSEDDPALRVALLVAVWAACSAALAIDVLSLLAARNFLSALVLMVFWLALGLISAFGAITLRLLASGSANSGWDRFDDNHHLGLALVFAALSVFLSLSHETWRRVLESVLFSRARRMIVLRGLLLFALLSLSIAFLAKGSEEGFAGIFQPVELNKFALLVITAVLLVGLDVEARYSRFGVWSTLRMWLFAFGVVAAVAVLSFIAVPVVLNDYSPIIVSIILVTATALFAYLATTALKARRVRELGRIRGEPRRSGFLDPDARLVAATANIGRATLAIRRKILWRQIRAALARNAPATLAALIVLLFTASLISAGAFIWSIDQSRLANSDQLLEFSQMTRRVAVAFDHVWHAEWAGQLWSAWRAMQSEPLPPCVWFGPELCRLFDLESDANTIIPPFNGLPIMQVPAVQDDFIAAFVVARFGPHAMVVLVLLQSVFILSAATGAVLAIRTRPGNVNDETGRLLLGVLGFGGAVLFAVHWAVSWSNLLSWLPIMGQPMTLISYARSHMLGMALPAVLIIILVLRSGPPRYSRT